VGEGKKLTIRKVSDVLVPIPSLLPGEQIFWYREIMEGFWHKKVVQIQMITNRAVRINDEDMDLQKIHRVEIVDKHSILHSTYSGYSLGCGSSRFGGIRFGRGSGDHRRCQFGDIVFFHTGTVAYTIHNVEDPPGVVQPIKAANPHIK
jgi:hypothetical protein